MAPIKGDKNFPVTDPQFVELSTSVAHTVGDTATAAYRSAVSVPEIDIATLDGSQETLGPSSPKGQTVQDINHGNRDALVMENLPLVKYIAHRIASRVPSHVDVDDLVNAGIIGLINAAERFEPGRNIKFKTYAEQRVKGEILDSLRDLDWVPRTMRRKKREIEAAFHILEQKYCRAAADEEVAEYLQISLEDFYKSLDELKGVTLGTFADNETQDGESIISIIPDPEAEDPHIALHESELRKILIKAVEELPTKEYEVVRLYYFRELNMKEIGNNLKITESRVSQLHTKAILRLRGKLLRQHVDGR
ncbi:MAG: FliA/WhiG family RNA polymerase sigma factor [Holophagaceae bacterium]|nr:FliA/WhiG family RNA polymerase sigma factor [Holophagaceae bacterium]